GRPTAPSGWSGIACEPSRTAVAVLRSWLSPAHSLAGGRPCCSQCCRRYWLLPPLIVAGFTHSGVELGVTRSALLARSSLARDSDARRRLGIQVCCRCCSAVSLSHSLGIRACCHSPS